MPTLGHENWNTSATSERLQDIHLKSEFKKSLGILYRRTESSEAQSCFTEHFLTDGGGSPKHEEMDH